MKICAAPFHLKSAEADWQPKQVLLFSGHMIDAPDRSPARFPAACQTLAAQAIQNALHILDAGTEDLALTQGACGGDILFAEACLHRGVHLQLLQPFAETEFVVRSVICGGPDWLARYRAVSAALHDQPLAAPDELYELAPTLSPYQRCNLWLLATALSYGLNKFTFICLWDGGTGDGAGGTAHMLAEVQKRHGRVVWLDTREIFEASDDGA